MQIIERIYKILNEKNLKAKDLSEYLGINQSVLSTWKKRCKNPPSEYIIQICEFLGTTPEYLLTGNDALEFKKEDLSDQKKLAYSLTQEEMEIITQWRKLSYEDKVILKGDLYKLLRDKSSSYDYENFMVAE